MTVLPAHELAIRATKPRHYLLHVHIRIWHVLVFIFRHRLLMHWLPERSRISFVWKCQLILHETCPFICLQLFTTLSSDYWCSFFNKICYFDNETHVAITTSELWLFECVIGLWRHINQYLANLTFLEHLLQLVWWLWFEHKFEHSRKFDLECVVPWVSLDQL